MDPDDLDPTVTPPAVPPVVAPLATPPAVVAPPVAPVPPPVATPPVGSAEADRRALIADHTARGASKALKKLFGTDDPAEIERIRAEQQAKLDEHAQMVAQQEAKKREQLTEVERLQTDIARLTEENTQLKAKLQKVEGDKVSAQQAAKINSLAINHISPKWLKYATNEFRDYVLSLTPAQQKILDDKRIAKWFADFAKQEPTCALEPPKAPEPALPAAPPVAKPPAPPAARPPLLAGARPPGLGPKPNAPPASNDPFAGLTPLPGKPNSMNKDQLRAYAKANNLPYPG